MFEDDKAEELAGHHLLGYSIYYQQTEGLEDSAEEIPNSLLLVFYYLLKQLSLRRLNSSRMEEGTEMTQILWGDFLAPQKKQTRAPVNKELKGRKIINASLRGSWEMGLVSQTQCHFFAY